MKFNTELISLGILLKWLYSLVNAKLQRLPNNIPANSIDPNKTAFDQLFVSSGSTLFVILSLFFLYSHPYLQQLAYRNITKTCLFKYTENFTNKKWKNDIFHTSAQNKDCGYYVEPPRRGGSNEYPQSTFWAEIRKIMYAPASHSFTI